MSREVEVLEGGLLTSVQDAAGRRGWRRFGVPQAGALDAFAALLANRLVANGDDAAVLEVTLVGPVLRLPPGTSVGLAGADLSATLDGRRLAPGTSRRAVAGGLLRFGERRRGARAYLALGGGIDVPVVLASRSTDLRSSFGGLEGRQLRAGDRLSLAAASRSSTPRVGSAQPDANDGAPGIRVLPGPHLDRFEEGALERLCSRPWFVSSEADRTGYRLDGERLPHLSAASGEVPSTALPLGAVQVPPDGRPIVMLADRPVTGGYPVVAVVARADAGRVAQLVPADELHFTLTTEGDARAALAVREAALVVAPDPDADLGWAGALE